MLALFGDEGQVVPRANNMVIGTSTRRLAGFPDKAEVFCWKIDVSTGPGSLP